MRANIRPTGTRALFAAIAIAMVMAGTLFSNPVSAKDHEVNIALHVSTVGFDLGRPKDARKIYTRIDHAAWQACNSADRVGLAPADNPPACYEDALARAVKSANAPLLTRLYLDNHTLQQAAMRGIREPARMAAQ